MTRQHDARIGTVLGDRYKIERLIGSGGMGSVYEAVDLTMGRQVAVKILSVSTDEAIKRFERECQVLASVEGSNTPQIFAWGEFDGGALYLVMELVPGKTLQQVLDAEGTLPVETVRGIALQICQALAAVHAKGIVHRDIKPSNIMLAGSTVKLMDFGVATLVSTDDEQRLTRSNQVIGSIDYMSHEHLTPKRLDARSDVFSLGCLIYRALQGRAPYQSGDAMESLLNMQSDKREPLPETVPLYMRQVVDRCLVRDPQRRFQSADALARALSTQSVSQPVVPVPQWRSYKQVGLS